MTWTQYQQTTQQTTQRTVCACPPDMSSVWATGQLHAPTCPLAAKRCTHCGGTGIEPPDRTKHPKEGGA